MTLLICLICQEFVQDLSGQKSNASQKRFEKCSRNARDRSHGFITCSANSHVSIGANSYGVEEYARRACGHTCLGYVSYVCSRSHKRLNYAKTRPIAALRYADLDFNSSAAQSLRGSRPHRPAPCRPYLADGCWGAAAQIRS